MTISVAVVIPTRNRPHEAMQAIKSLIPENGPAEIYVCDNSDSAEPLREFCTKQPRVTYLRPEHVVAMGRNWDWAVREAMERSSATHFSVHYDRKVSKPGVWSDLAALATTRPNLLHSFPLDHLGHEPPPLRLWQPPWTGKCFSVSTQRVSALLASGCVTEICHALPVFSNCLVPRPILTKILERFGTVCDATGPDGAFMCRFFALEDSYIHYDRALGILHASLRSNGLGYLRGAGGDFPDFVRLSGGDSWLHAAPIPGMNLGNNMLYHEYELVRRETGDRLPAIDRPAVLKDLGLALRWIADPGLAAEYKAMLTANGWAGPEPEPLPEYGDNEAAYQRQLQRRMFWLGEMPSTITGFAFRNDRQALKWALRHPRQRQEDYQHIGLIDPTPIA